MTKDLTAHNNKESGAACLIRFTTNALNNTLDTGAVSKLFTDTNSNNKPYKKNKLDYSGSSRSMHVIEDNHPKPQCT